MTSLNRNVYIIAVTSYSLMLSSYTIILPLIFIPLTISCLTPFCEWAVLSTVMLYVAFLKRRVTLKPSISSGIHGSMHKPSNSGRIPRMY